MISCGVAPDSASAAEVALRTPCAEQCGKFACRHQSLNLFPNPFAVNGFPYSVSRKVRLARLSLPRCSPPDQGAMGYQCRSDFGARSSPDGNARGRRGHAGGRGAAHLRGALSYTAGNRAPAGLRPDRMPFVILSDFLGGPTVVTVRRYFSFLTPIVGLTVVSSASFAQENNVRKAFTRWFAAAGVSSSRPEFCARAAVPSSQPVWLRARPRSRRAPDVANCECYRLKL